MGLYWIFFAFKNSDSVPKKIFLLHIYIRNFACTLQSFSSRFSFSFCKFLSLSSTRAEFTFAQTADAPRVFI